MPVTTLILLVSAVAWFAAVEWLRHRVASKQEDSGKVPRFLESPLTGPLGSFVLIVAALVSYLLPQPLPSVATEDIPAPSTASSVIKRGNTLQDIARAAYGKNHFSGFVAELNGIQSANEPTAGTTVKTPSISVAFRDAGLSARYQPAINVLAKAWLDYLEVLPAYVSARQSSGVQRGTFTITDPLRDKLLACARAVEAAVRVLRSAKPPHAAPRMTVRQFEEAATHLRTLASGECDGYGYDYDLVGQHFGYGFRNALIWAKNQHR